MGNFSTIRVLILCSLFLMCTSSESVANVYQRFLEQYEKLYKMDHVAHVTILKLDYYQNITKLEAPSELNVLQVNMTSLYAAKLRSLEILRDEATNQNPGKDVPSCYDSAQDSLDDVLDEIRNETDLCEETYNGDLQHIYDSVNQAVQAIQKQSSEMNTTEINCFIDADCIASKIEIIEPNLNASIENGNKVLENGPVAFSNAVKHLEDCFGSSNEHFRVKTETVHQQAVDCIAKL